MTKPEPTNGEDGGDGSNKNRATRGQHHVRTLKAKGSGNTEKVESHENNDKVIALAKHYNIQNVTNDFIRALGAQFTPSYADNHSKLLAELRCRMGKCA